MNKDKDWEHLKKGFFITTGVTLSLMCSMFAWAIIAFLLEKIGIV